MHNNHIVKGKRNGINLFHFSNVIWTPSGIALPQYFKINSSVRMNGWFSVIFSARSGISLYVFIAQWSVLSSTAGWTNHRSGQFRPRPNSRVLSFKRFCYNIIWHALQNINAVKEKGSCMFFHCVWLTYLLM